MRKKLRERRVGLLLLLMASFVSFVGASDPLNPLVIRGEGPLGAVPADCETGLRAAPMARVDLRDVPLPEPPTPAALVAPPSGTLRAQLEDVQNALVRNDRPAFDAALAEVKATTEAHPLGGERRAAEELIRIYEGAQKLWDAQYQSPFFDESAPEYAIASGYRGYAEAIRRNTFTDANERRFYPAAESRAFLTGIAADRLKALGVRTPARVAQREATTARTLSPARPRPSRTSSRSKSSSKPKPRKSAAVSSASSSPNPSTPPTTAAVPKPAAPPVTESSPTPSSTATASSPAAGEPPAVEPSVPAPDTAISDTAISDTAISETTVTETTITETTATETAAPVVPDTRPARERSVVLPAILILAGLAVLVVLFRASK